MRLCGCGCGKTLVRHPREGREDFSHRKYFNKACAIRARKGQSIIISVRNERDHSVIHPLIDKFLYGRAA